MMTFLVLRIAVRGIFLAASVALLRVSSGTAPPDHVGLENDHARGQRFCFARCLAPPLAGCAAQQNGDFLSATQAASYFI